MHNSMSLPSSSYASSLLQPAPIMMPAPRSSFGASSSNIRSRTAAALRANNEYDDDPYAPHYQLYPRSYTVQRAPYSLWDSIDGNIEKDVWQTVPFSEAFGDIQGDARGDCAGRNGKDDGDDDALPPLPPPPIGETRFKALYDDEYLYIAAILHAAATDNSMPTIASFTQRNSPIYQQDSDFEVFVDTFHSQHMYKEFEVNAINTVWNLCLDKPYENGGAEHSGRIAVPGEALYYEVNRQQTATRIVHGHVNDVHGHGATWTVEMAWSIDDLMQTVGTRLSSPSATGTASSTGAVLSDDSPTFWRINFSRVERQGDVNWTWQAQTRWDASPEQSRFRGYINMHQPDSWGYLVLAPSSIAETTPGTEFDIAYDTWRDPHWPAKLTAMTVYHALQQYKEDHGEYTNRMEALNVPLTIVEPFDIDIRLVAPTKLVDNDHSSQDNDDLYFMVTVQSIIDNTAVAVRNDRFLTVLCRSDDAAMGIADSATVKDIPFNADA